MECDHCFVWGSPRTTGTMSIDDVRAIVHQAHEIPDIRRICFEGGEPFLYYPLLARAVAESHEAGYDVGIVTNGYWAASVADALLWLRPLEGTVSALSVSLDLFHGDDSSSRRSENVTIAARKLGMPVHVIATSDATVMYRGRAATKLARGRARECWEGFSRCPHENLADPGRVHVDPFGNVHVCQGISIGNVFETGLKRICDTYEPEQHPIVGPLIRGGPAELVRSYDLAHQADYVDACHLCYTARVALRDRFPRTLTPDQAYGPA